jgi:RNA recognition motif-containing protein
VFKFYLTLFICFCFFYFYSFFIFLFNIFLMNIFVAKLNFSTSSEALREAFEGFGSVESANVIMDKETNRSKGFGFVEMSSDDEAREAIKELDGSDLDGRTIVVKQAEDREKRTPSDRPRRDFNAGGGGGNRGGGFGGGGGYDNNRGGGGYDRNDRPRRDSNSNNSKWGRD